MKDAFEELKELIELCGVPVVALSVPVRYLHSQEKMISLSDLKNLIKLLKRFLEVF